VSSLQATAHKILGTTAFRGKNAQKEHMTQRGYQDNGQYSSNDKHIAAKQTSTQTLKDKLQQAREESAPPNVQTLANFMPKKRTSFGNYETKRSTKQ